MPQITPLIGIALLLTSCTPKTEQQQVEEALESTATRITEVEKELAAQDAAIEAERQRLEQLKQKLESIETETSEATQPPTPESTD